MRVIGRSRGVLLAVLLGLTVLAVMTWMWNSAREASLQQTHSVLDSGHRQQLQALEELKAQFTSDTARMAEDPAFVAYVLASRDRGAAGLASITDLLDERLVDLGADSAQVFSAAGVAVAGIGELERQTSQTQRWAALQQVLQTGEAISGWLPHADGVWLVAITPLRQGPLLEGLLVSARGLDAGQLAERVKASQLEGQLLTERTQTLVALLQQPAQVLPADALLQQWRTQPAAARDDEARLSPLPAPGEPVWLLTTLGEERRNALHAEQNLLAAGLAVIALCMLVLLAWIWRSGRRRIGGRTLAARPQHAAKTERPRPQITDQERGELLHEVLEHAQRMGSPARVELPAGDAGIPDSRYQMISFQGETALARIYRVDDRLLNRVMLLFVLHSSTPRDTARSLRIATELGKAGLIQHRNLVSVQRVARTQSRLLITTDDVSGLSLRELLERIGPLPAEVAMLIAKRVGAAQLRLNDAGVLLRSIDPDQILFLPDGAVKLLPLALASGESPSLQGLAAWTAEQWLAADRRTEVLTFGDLLSTLFPESTANAQLPPAWQALIERCTASDPAQRYSGTDTLMAALDAL